MINPLVVVSDKINDEISHILRCALRGDVKYRTGSRYERWGLVESDIHKAVRNILLYGTAKGDTDVNRRINLDSNLL
jgi:hypothetical protein